MENDKLFMQRCIELAQLGIRKVYPNPMVGAVIVHDGKIIGEGYHKSYGNEHAEVNAVNSINDKSILNEATVYISLEPCAHHGKTPPCADLLVRHNFKRVVIGCLDTFSEVSGKGISILKDNGIEVCVGILENECRELNKRFFTFHEKNRPYIILKWAESIDGFIDRDRTSDKQEINWITKPETQTLVHQWRSEEHAILVGNKTVIKDNPSLTVRNVTGENPIRIVIDPDLKTSLMANVFNRESKTIIFNKKEGTQKDNIHYIQLEDFSVNNILQILHKNNIQSVIVEGGTNTIQRFIDNNLWDEAYTLVGGKTFGKGLESPKLAKNPISSFPFFGDLVFQYKNNTK